MRRISASTRSSAVSEQLVHGGGLVALDKIRFVAIAVEQIRQLLSADPGKHGGIGDLEPVQVEDRQHRAVARRVQEFVGVPARGQRASLGFAVADDTGDNQVRIVERGSISVGQRIAELAAFVDRPWRFRRDVTWNAVGPGELAEQPLHPVPATIDIRVDLGIGSLQVGVRHQARAAMARTDNADHVQVIQLDQAIEMDVDEIQPRRRAPMAKQARFEVFQPKRNLKKRIVLQIDLPDGQVVCRTPIGVHLLKKFGRQRVWHRDLRAGPLLVGRD